MRLKLAILLGVLVVPVAYAQTPPTVTPRACNLTVVATGGTAVQAITGPSNAFTIKNPLTATDQGIGAAEPLTLDMVGNAALTGNGTTLSLAPGESFSWTYQSTQTNPVSVNATTSGHKFACERW